MVIGLINTLKSLPEQPESYHKEELIEALEEIDNLAELENPKQIITDLVKLWLLEVKNNGKISKKSFHTVIYGPSGVGKSLFAKCLAKVFRSFSNKRIEAKQTIGFYLEELIDNYEGKKIPKEVLKTYWTKIKEAYQGGISIIKNPDTTPEIIYCGRNELIGSYSGWTTDKTRKFLSEHLGHYLILEEAYILCTSITDGYGKEALTEISQFMDRLDSPIFIFTGYEDQIKEYLFKIQPGLVRRIDMTFKLDGYTPIGLASIFKKQVERDNWKLHESVEIIEFFIKNLDKFPHFGGDTIKLAYACMVSAASRIMDNGEGFEDLIIITQDLLTGLDRFLLVSVLDF